MTIIVTTYSNNKDGPGAWKYTTPDPHPGTTVKSPNAPFNDWVQFEYTNPPVVEGEWSCYTGQLNQSQCDWTGGEPWVPPVHPRPVESPGTLALMGAVLLIGAAILHRKTHA